MLRVGGRLGGRWQPTKVKRINNVSRRAVHAGQDPCLAVIKYVRDLRPRCTIQHKYKYRPCYIEVGGSIARSDLLSNIFRPYCRGLYMSSLLDTSVSTALRYVAQDAANNEEDGCSKAAAVVHNVLDVEACKSFQLLRQTGCRTASRRPVAAFPEPPGVCSAKIGGNVRSESQIARRAEVCDLLAFGHDLGFSSQMHHAPDIYKLIDLFVVPFVFFPTNNHHPPRFTQTTAIQISFSI